jgi:mannose-1-phosphate guanylyltransferase
LPEFYALILSGGAGTRLWPRSRRARPKQFLDLLGEGRSLFAATVERLDGVIPASRTYVVAPPDHAPLIRRDAPAVPEANFVTEPYPRGNAAAIGLALAVIGARDADGVVAVLPSDHVIEREDAFRQCLRAAHQAASAGYLVTLGIAPDRPDTGFGYIERGDDTVADGVYAVRRFVEKPKREAAEEMLRTGRHLWNAGMFVFRLSRALEEYDRNLPRTASAIRAVLEVAGTPRFAPVLADAWEETEQTTIDYGVMEKADRVAVVPADIGWHDVGNWARLAEIVQKRNTRPPKTLLGEGSRGVYVYSPEKVVAAIGVDDLVIVETEDALLVCRKDRAEEVKAIVERLQREGRADLL